MEPLSVTVAAIVTGFLSKGVQAFGKQVGEAASNAAQTLAQAVLDRLRKDPLEERTVARYEADPAAHEESLKSAVGDAIEADADFKARLEKLVAEYRKAEAMSGIVIGGDVDGNVVQGNENIVVRDMTGNMRVGRDRD